MNQITDTALVQMEANLIEAFHCELTRHQEELERILFDWVKLHATTDLAEINEQQRIEIERLGNLINALEAQIKHLKVDRAISLDEEIKNA